jgi:molybdopterin-containing oxidoreductase family iron-sulfur binding subunit
MSYDLARIRAQLAGRSGPAFWRGLEAVAGTAEFQAFLQAEFPAAAAYPQRRDRRRFLKLMAASLMLGGLAGCDDSDGRDQEIPYVRKPDRIEPGASLNYASGAMFDGFANGVLVTTREGRPISITGNPQHPWSRGGTDILAQASVLGLYDPDRSQSVMQLSRPSSWQAFRAGSAAQFAILRANGGRGLRLLTGPVTSPSLLAQIDAMRASLPQMHWHTLSAVDRAPLYEGTRRAFGQRLETRWRFDRAALVVSLDGDFLDLGPQQVGAARRWAEARRASAERGGLLTLYSAAATPSLTSAKADDHVVASPAAIAELARALLADAAVGTPAAAGGDPVSQWRHRVSTALLAARGRGVVTAGGTQPAEIHELVHRLNARLGNAGQTVVYTAPLLGEAETMAALAGAMHNGEVDTLLALDANLVYAAPVELDIVAALDRVRRTVHAGVYLDETALRSDWHLPLTHPLESWADARAMDGTVTLLQPTVAPFFGGRSVPQILSTLVDPAPLDGQQLLLAHWQRGASGADFERQWHQALLDGFIANSALPEVTPTLTGAAAAAPAPVAAEGIDVLFRPDATVWDGSVANNAWLQELPKPLTKTVWENEILVAPALAQREHLADGDVVALEAGGRSLRGPVRIMPGQADGTATVTLGYGRGLPDMVLSGLGYDATPLRPAATPWLLSGVRLTRTGETHSVATTELHGAMEGEQFVRVQQVGAPPVGAPDRHPTLYKDPEGTKAYGSNDTEPRAWGMVIDLDACIGCNACVVACQSENNIPVVGREQVAEGREMHWLRIDRYYSGSADDPGTQFMPVPCMHCEDAPCEVGCPVDATLHDHEGLNLMVYNRCIGTRACSGYCPYKVRHFNWLDYSDGEQASIQARNNPDVTVRARGVMEKCTYCVQRIADARIESDKSGQPIADGRVQTACQSACPSQAITFGNLADPNSAVAAARRDPRNYALLGELNVRPRTTYLAAWAPPEVKA